MRENKPGKPTRTLVPEANKVWALVVDFSKAPFLNSRMVKGASGIFWPTEMFLAKMEETVLGANLENLENMKWKRVKDVFNLEIYYYR